MPPHPQSKTFSHLSPALSSTSSPRTPLHVTSQQRGTCHMPDARTYLYNIFVAPPHPSAAPYGPNLQIYTPTPLSQVPTSSHPPLPVLFPPPHPKATTQQPHLQIHPLTHEGPGLLIIVHDPLQQHLTLIETCFLWHNTKEHTMRWSAIRHVLSQQLNAMTSEIKGTDCHRFETAALEIGFYTPAKPPIRKCYRSANLPPSLSYMMLIFLCLCLYSISSSPLHN